MNGVMEAVIVRIGYAVLINCLKKQFKPAYKS